jgi:hypothetical protein
VPFIPYKKKEQVKPEVERCGEKAALCNAIRLDRVKEEEDVQVAP